MLSPRPRRLNIALRATIDLGAALETIRVSTTPRDLRRRVRGVFPRLSAIFSPGKRDA
jgi:hypothetical protein